MGRSDLYPLLLIGYVLKHKAAHELLSLHNTTGSNDDQLLYMFREKRAIEVYVIFTILCKATSKQFYARLYIC